MATPVINSGIHDLNELLQQTEVQQAFDYFEASAQHITEEQIEICSVPASPFHESTRADFMRLKFESLRLSNVQIDAEGNCVALRSGLQQSPLLVLSAHLDTVFPTATDFSIKRVGSRLFGPGISDDGCGLVALVTLLRVLQQFKITTCGSILFVATVGEEGEGNLRGVRHLFTAGEWANKIDGFVSFDGAGVSEITHRALGSRRYQVEVTGSGGHSWIDFGVANPVHSLGRVIATLAAYPAPLEPRTSFNVGRIAGGTSVNAIPTQASMEVDLRSATDDELLRIDAFFRRAVRDAIDVENNGRRAGSEPLKLKLNLIGARPGGETSRESRLVELAFDATQKVGINPSSEQASTDANLPISLGIPAITLGAGGISANSHTLDEWYEPADRHLALQRALLLLLSFAGFVRQKSPDAV
jgi:tripeptide aminopeptidase